jgi:hypothetical protein
MPVFHNPGKQVAVGPMAVDKAGAKCPEFGLGNCQAVISVAFPNIMHRHNIGG